MSRKVKFPIEMSKISAKYPPYIIPRSGTIKSKVLALSNEVFPFCVRTFGFGRIERQPLIPREDYQFSHAFLFVLEIWRSSDKLWQHVSVTEKRHWHFRNQPKILDRNTDEQTRSNRGRKSSIFIERW